jgi:uncharacterized protein YceK
VRRLFRASAKASPGCQLATWLGNIDNDATRLASRVRITVSGTMEVYLADGTLYDKFVTNTASSISWSAVDGAGNGYVFQLPKIKFSDAKVTGGALNSDAMLSIPFTALMDPVTGKTIIIDRVGNGV